MPQLRSPDEYSAWLAGDAPQWLREQGRFWMMCTRDNVDSHRFLHGGQELLRQSCGADQLRRWLDQDYELLDERVYNGIYLLVYEADSEQTIS